MQKEMDVYTFSGEKMDFEKLYFNYAPYAFKVAMLVTKNNQFAADIVQETFIRVYTNLSKFDQDKPFKPWFYKILINECNRHMSRNKRKFYMEDCLDTEISQPCDMESSIENREVCNELAKLDISIRTPLILKYIHGFTANEISEIMGININTIKSRMSSGKQKLRKALTKFNGEVM